MSKDIWDERRRGLEAEFFVKQNRLLAEKLKQQCLQEQACEELAATLGIRDPEVLSKFLEQQITVPTMLALALLPLVQVAWADGHLEAAERTAILRAAKERGMPVDGPAYQLLLGWLKAAPSSALRESWLRYVESLRARLEPASFSKLGLELLEQASGVAQAAGGFLGLGNKISEAEADELDFLAQAFGLTAASQ